jgi:hypothetical protein
MLHDVDQLGVLLFKPPHIPSHRGVRVRVGLLLAQVLIDALRRQPLAKSSLNLRAVRLGDTGRPVRLARAGRQVGRFCFTIRRLVARRLGAGGQVGRICLTLRVVARHRLAADTGLALDAPIAPAQLKQGQYASFVGHFQVVPHGHLRSDRSKMPERLPQLAAFTPSAPGRF